MSVQNILRFTAELHRGVVMTPLRMAFLRGEDMGHCFLIRAVQGAQTVDLTGATVNGYMIRADGTTLTIPGEVSDGCAALALPAAAYSVPGRFRLVIQSALDGAVTTLFWGEGAVSASWTETIAIPEEIIRNLCIIKQELVTVQILFRFLRHIILIAHIFFVTHGGREYTPAVEIGRIVVIDLGAVSLRPQYAGQ